jgi:hypothetical protein
MKLSYIDYIIIFVLAIGAGLVIHFISTQSIVSVDANGNVDDVAYVKKGVLKKPSVPKVGEPLFKVKKAA